jgi:hypothetical protein
MRLPFTGISVYVWRINQCAAQICITSRVAAIGAKWSFARALYRLSFRSLGRRLFKLGDASMVHTSSMILLIKPLRDYYPIMIECPVVTRTPTVRLVILIRTRARVNSRLHSSTRKSQYGRLASTARLCPSQRASKHQPCPRAFFAFIAIFGLCSIRSWWLLDSAS